MSKEEIIQYFKEEDFKELSREDILYHLFLNGEILLSDYLEVQSMLDFNRL